ncbi:nuclear transport factor 2 family protein [Streptomyces sp. NK08204]|uniref:nuclear transport factor 2 family protein n=1 Tax=Streptomyces sp. NK08204 TaxID=2873260 RepID=UPI0027E3B0E6|nr:nuclear transport factor 2 family protein [Streptomyces sp. NK08204]
MAEHSHAAVLVRTSYDAFSRGDMDTLRGLMAADCAPPVPGSHPVSGDLKGVEAVLGMYRRLILETGGPLRIRLRDVFVRRPGHAVAVHHLMAERAGMRYDDGSRPSSSGSSETRSPTSAWASRASTRRTSSGAEAPRTVCPAPGTPKAPPPAPGKRGGQGLRIKLVSPFPRGERRPRTGSGVPDGSG